MKSLFKASTVLALLSPMIALGQSGAYIPTTGTDFEAADPTTVDSWLDATSTWVSNIAIIFMAVGVAVFFWGIIQYVIAGADEEKRAAGRSLMIYGIIGLFAMVAVWGLVYLLGGTLGVGIGGGADAPGIPCIPGTPGCDAAGS